MAIKVVGNVDNPADALDASAYGTGAVIRWERATSQAFTTPTELGTQALSATKTQYEWWDQSGTTVHWYRFRLSNAGNTLQSAYSDPFQAGALAAYATLDSLREYVDPPDDASDNLLSDILVRATGIIDARCGRSFFRDPQVTGTTTKTFDVGATTKVISADIVSLTSVSYATATGISYTVAGGTDWYLQPANPAPGWPYEELVVSDVGTIPYWYGGYRTVQVTGVFGWASVPAAIEGATLALAGELYYRGRGGRTVGLEFGRLPSEVEVAVEAYKRRSWIGV